VKPKQGSGEKDAGMKPIRQIINWFLVLLWFLFMGVTAVSMGIGALYPPLNDIAGPFVCPHGRIQVTSQVYTVSPVESVNTLTYYCVDKQTGAQTELALWPKHLIAGSIYGLLCFVIVLAIWYFITRRSYEDSQGSQELVPKILLGFSIVLFVGFNLLWVIPSFHPMAPATATPDATATSIAHIFQSLNMGGPIAFSSTDKPLANWNGIPIMSQATAGQQINDTTYAFRTPDSDETIESFYRDTLKSLGWNLENSPWMGMEFAKGKKTLMISIAILDDPSCTTPRSPGDTPSPAFDLGCHIVTLVIVP
jgi:hypothetical protein